MKETNMAEKIGNMTIGAFIALMVAIAVILVGSILMLTRRRRGSYVQLMDPIQTSRTRNAGLMPTSPSRSGYDPNRVY